MQKDVIGIKELLNLSYLVRYSKLQFRYLGHRVEVGSKRNGPDYYSLLNPSLKTNYTEDYFSDRLNLFYNKLLLQFNSTWRLGGNIINNPVYSSYIVNYLIRNCLHKRLVKFKKISCHSIL